MFNSNYGSTLLLDGTDNNF